MKSVLNKAIEQLKFIKSLIHQEQICREKYMITKHGKGPFSRASHFRFILLIVEKHFSRSRLLANGVLLTVVNEKVTQVSMLPPNNLQALQCVGKCL